jgi:hypothetical protein
VLVNTGAMGTRVVDGLVVAIRHLRGNKLRSPAAPARPQQTMRTSR